MTEYTRIKFKLKKNILGCYLLKVKYSANLLYKEFAGVA